MGVLNFLWGLNAPIQVFHGKYHDNILDFKLLLPKKLTKSGAFSTYHLSESFEHGNFVRKRRSIDDPEMISYGVDLDGKQHHVDLWPNRELLSPHGLIVRHAIRRGKHIDTFGEKKMCYWTGLVRDAEDSSVALSTCDGLLGSIRVGEKEYFIEPLKDHGPNEDGHYMHVTHDLVKRRIRDEIKCQICGVTESWDEAIGRRIREQLETLKKPNQEDGKEKREYMAEIAPKYLETAVVVDKSFIAFHKGKRDMDLYLLTLFNLVFNYLRDKSFPVDITLSITRVIYLEKEGVPAPLTTGIDIRAAVDDTGYFSEVVNFPEDNPLHHDFVFLLSRLNFCNSIKKDECTIVGRAPVGGMCLTNRSLAVVEDAGMSAAAFTLTHEACHTMAAYHDGANGTVGESCVDDRSSKFKYLMGVWTSPRFIGLSLCSQVMIEQFFRQGFGRCLDDEPEKSNKQFTHALPGTLYGYDEQCKLFKNHKRNSTKCCYKTCNYLYCDFLGPGSCNTRYNEPLDGTPCGQNKWCYRGNCVQEGQRPTAIDGGWSPWTGWSACSRTCGGGISYNKRLCNNPRPENNGRHCIGLDRKVSLCNTENCETSVRNATCATLWNGTGIPVSWAENPCRIMCQKGPKSSKYNLLKSTVPDGAECDPFSPRDPKSRCLAGICQTLGCDGQIYSPHHYDECMVCDGDGTSCTPILGRFTKTINRDNATATEKFHVLPKGAFNIRIWEVGTSAPRINLRTEDEEEKLLIGNQIESTTLTAAIDLGGVFAYGIRNGEKENYTIPGPIPFSMGIYVAWRFYGKNVTSADLKYKYSMKFGNETEAVERKKNYRWEANDWTACDKLCDGGIQHTLVSCVEEKFGKVPDKFCAGMDKMKSESKACNEFACKTRWRFSIWSDCLPCKEGIGAKTRPVECMAENPDQFGDEIVVDDDKCDLPRPARFQLCKKPPYKCKTKRDTRACTFGLPDRFTDHIWDELTGFSKYIS